MKQRRGGAVLVRCDANSVIGLGHVARALAVAEEIANRHASRCVVLARPSPLISAFLRSRPVELRPLTGEGYAAAEVTSMTQEGTVLVTDSYEIDAAAISAVRETGATHVVIDDFAELDRWPCDVVVNPNLGASPDPYRGAGTVLVGPKYALLRREVRDAAEKSPRPVTSDGRRLLVCLGGGEWGAAGRNILRAVGELSLRGIEVRATLRSGEAPPGVIAVSPESLIEQLRWADAAVLSGGVVKYEAAACGLPSLLLAVVEHQADVARSFAETGGAHYLGTVQNTSGAKVKQQAQLLLKDRPARVKMRQSGRGLIDGEGVVRVANALCPPPELMR